ncbi:helix-turn-helix domain-containing protein (plasmid) [Streptomyces sp. NBC_01136]|uniref:helix-turn-helix transcriptional regulator n=1 Tax=unclassified Streptomyces TaxID=2593676 RepID=UPI0033DE463B|nr:helix-turn-helix domain-containing protein [Streptomyces sp. NBC_01136]
MSPKPPGVFRPSVLADLRQRAQLSRTELALLAGVSPETVRAAETGKHCPSARVLRALAEALAVPVDRLSPVGKATPTLKQLRRRTGQTQKQTAEAIGVSGQMVSRVEAGVYGVRDPVRWAAGYQVSPAEWTAAWEAGKQARRKEIKAGKHGRRGGTACQPSSQPGPSQESRG